MSKKALIQELNAGALLKRVLYRDDHIIVVDKPSGIPVHIGAHSGVALEQYFEQLKFGADRTPSLAHRLDRETSGCLVLGRTRESLAALGKLFAEGENEKSYWAVVVGAPAEDAGTINRPILKVGQGSRWRITLDDAGQEAITDYKVMGKGVGISWLEMKPRTGRTHQLRVHSAMGLGCPLVGDPFYGVSEGEYSADTISTMLHARSIALPMKHKRIEVTAPVPAHMRVLLEKCGYQD